MEKTIVRVKRWGNSFGIVLPKTVIDNQQLKEGTEIEVLVQAKNKTKVKDVFGIMKGKIKRDTESLLKEVDRDFEG
ncbi:AbrB/MazE/SpoVT family DNA-binding domain-containing protein [Candidatus Pacearchaeota archaeon]|nr:AbrB/MazE/SpoVT family DNA-binding domain-containing protein [Candidatus Pacearchaeota archaeon]